MKRHDTPPEVATVLARHMPRNVTSLLDPSVGSGALVAPFVKRLSRNGRLTCVDISPAAIDEAKKNLGRRVGLGIDCDYVTGDFLKWSTKRLNLLAETFDTVVLNPPFAGKLNEWCDAPAEILGFRSRVPLEIAFLFRCIELTKPGGSVLAIVPASVICGEQTGWLREHLLTKGAIKFVRELPLSTFPGVECRFYLLVFVKGARSEHSVLCNHDLEGKERMQVSTQLIRNHLRLDFAFYESVRDFEQLRSAVKGEWSTLADRCEIIRGRIASPEGARRGMHTTDYFDGVWYGNERHKSKRTDDPRFNIMSHDLLMSRVGRRCLLTCGRSRYSRGVPLSDCVICFRPSKPKDSIDLLFTIRVLFGSVLYQSQLVRGSGASFVTMRSLQSAWIPDSLKMLFPREFSRFEVAAKKFDVSEMRKIEDSVRRKLSLV